MHQLIHSTAVVDATARIGANTTIGPYAVIEADAEIGADCSIGSHAVIKPHTLMGDKNQIFEGAVIGGIPQDLDFVGSKTVLKIGHCNIIREGVTIHRSASTKESTVVGNDNYLMAHAHVAHNCVLEDHIVIANNVLLAGHVHVESHSFISGGVVVHQFCQIGVHSMIGGNSKVVQDVLPFFLADGIPARTKAVNRIGLQRAEFSSDQASNLKRAFRILSKTGLKLTDRIADLNAVDCTNVKHLVSFIERSERGFCRFE